MFEHQSGSEGWVVPGLPRPTAAPAPVLPPGPVAVLVRAARDLQGWAPAEEDGPQVLAAVEALLHVEQALSAVRVRALAEVHRRALHRLADARSLRVWLREHGLTAGGAELQLARRLPGFPTVAEALAEGRLGVQAARQVQEALSRLLPHVDRADGLIDGQPAEEALYGVVVHGVTDLVCTARGSRADDDPDVLELLQRLLAVQQAPASQLERLEQAFVLLARELPTDRGGRALDDALGTLTDALLPEQLAARDERGERDRDLALTRRRDGSGWRLTADLSLATGERLHAALQAELRRDPDNALDTATAAELREQGQDPYDPEGGLSSCTRPRRLGQRRHDALDLLLQRYLGAGLGGTHDKVPVQVLVTVPAAALEDAPGALPARAASGARLPAGLVRRWSCTAALTRFVLGLGGRVVESSHTGRTLTAHERRVLLLQTGGTCQAAGCWRSARDPGVVMHPHHADPWARSGRTSLLDTVLLCDHSHADVHQGRVIVLKDGRRLGPAGWVT